MKTFNSRQLLRLVCAALLILVSVSSAVLVGSVRAAPQIDVTVNPSKTIDANKLSVGFELTREWEVWRDRPELEQLAGDANFKLVRVQQYCVEPCRRWYEATRTGSFNWANVDLLVERIFELGAEPFICLGRAKDIRSYLPSGMAIDPATGLPYPKSWAAYCAEWVKHFKQTGKPVRFYEVINEPYLYFGWNDWDKMGNIVALYNTARPAMRAANPNILMGVNIDNRQNPIDYWLNPNFKIRHQVGADVEFFSFHKYDSGNSAYSRTDQDIFNRAETHKIHEEGWYSPNEVRQLYFNARGKNVLIIDSEGNFNSAYEEGTDPRIQQMAGAIWLALKLRTLILADVDASIYFNFASSASWEQANKASGGVGFGMINSDDKEPWYPYFVQWMIGNGLSVGDSIVESVSSSNEIRVLSWIHEGRSNIFLVCKVDQPRTIILHGISGQLNISKIDSTISWETPSLQTNVVNSTDPLVMNGYTVMRLQSF